VAWRGKRGENLGKTCGKLGQQVENLGKTLAEKGKNVEVF